MARPIRFQYSGGCYHVMARGDGGKVIFEDDDDRKIFIARLGEVCGRCGWKVHAWVLMGNHFHLLLETPEANLVDGMKWLLGTFSQGWNRARQRRGHVFQGRYKSVPVNGEDTGAYYFRIVADYIHLNPARAGLAGGKRGKLVDYEWSSLVSYVKGKGPDWLFMDRVLRAFELAQDGRGRRAYVAWLEARAKEDGGKINPEAEAALRRGWYLGEESFKDKLLAMVDRAKGQKKNPRRSAVDLVNAHGEAEAERLITQVGRFLRLPLRSGELGKLRKGDERKVLLALLLRKRTTVGMKWIAERLAMGHPGAVSRLIGGIQNNKGLNKKLKEVEKMLNSGD
jgi:REP element-mobilizing transposase RayT